MKRYLIIILTMVGVSLLHTASAQLNPLSSQYYTNTYLSNPANAGFEKGAELFATFRQQWNKIPGTPLTQNVNAAYGFERVGAGLNVNIEKAGLQRQTRVLGTFAYHLPLNGNETKLNFGLSLGFMKQTLDMNALNGNPNDVLVGDYNNRETYLDGDFGLAFSTKSFTAEAAIPNLKSFFKKDVINLANVATFYSAIAYKFVLAKGSAQSEIELEPKVVYRGIQGFDNIWDGGVRLAFASRQLALTGIYHSNESATFGVGMDFRRKYIINAMYTTNTAVLNKYLNGGFEINLGLKL